MATRSPKGTYKVATGLKSRFWSAIHSSAKRLSTSKCRIKNSVLPPWWDMPKSAEKI